jgi:hypothetical protein
MLIVVVSSLWLLGALVTLGLCRGAAAGDALEVVTRRHMTVL